MADTIKQIGIKDSSGSGYDNRDIGAEAQNIEISFNSQGEIIEDITTPGVVVSETKGASEVIKDLQDQINGKTPLEHVDEIASTSKLGHIKKGTGINIANDGTASVAYGSAAGTAAQGNDSRLSDARKNPNAVTFSDGKATPTTVAYDGSEAKTISYSNVGAAPTSHASSSTTYGVASDSNYGHVKIGSGLSASNGVAAVNFVAAGGTDSNKAVPGSDARLSDARTPKSHIASGTTYGGATGSYYGHAKLSDTYNSAVSGGAAANGVAASQNALYNAYNELNNNIFWTSTALSVLSNDLAWASLTLEGTPTTGITLNSSHNFISVNRDNIFADIVFTIAGNGITSVAIPGMTDTYGFILGTINATNMSTYFSSMTADMNFSIGRAMSGSNTGVNPSDGLTIPTTISLTIPIYIIKHNNIGYVFISLNRLTSTARTLYPKVPTVSGELIRWGTTSNSTTWYNMNGNIPRIGF